MALQDNYVNVDRFQHELKNQGTSAFPCAGYRNCCTNRKSEEIPWHYHDEMEFIMIKTGRMIVQTPEHITTVSKGDGIWINSCILHYAIADPACELNSVVYSSSLISEDQSSAIYQRYLSPLIHCRQLDSVFFSHENTEEKKLIDGFENAFRCLDKDIPGYEITMRDVLSKMILHIDQKYEDLLISPAKSASVDSLRAQKILDYIHANTDHQITIAELSSEINVSPREIIRCFQKTLHTSPIQYSLKYRVVQSSAMLQHTDAHNIAETARCFGFDSPSYYTKLFERYFLCSPREYIKAHQE
jgi:AraC-like DNA-binding protein